MERDAELLLEHGADGLALGVLRADGRIDRERCAALINRIGGGRTVVFHRAFDLTPEPLEALDRLIDLGVRRVLTSGQRVSAAEGADLIRRLIEHAGGRIEVLPGGGITAENAAELVARTGAGQVHGSFSERRSDPAGPVGEAGYAVTSARKLRETRAALARL
jgi:copper homeostasis protein